MRCWVLTASVLLGAAPVPLSGQVLGGAGTHPEIETHVALRGFQRRILLDTMVVWQDVPATPRRAWAAALRILDSLKVPVARRDSVRGVISHPGFVARSRLADRKVSHALRCGVGLTGEYADYWRVTVAYAVYVQPAGEHSRVGVALVAGAQDVEGVSKPTLLCSTTGMFEQRFGQLLLVAVR